MLIRVSYLLRNVGTAFSQAVVNVQNMSHLMVVVIWWAQRWSYSRSLTLKWQLNEKCGSLRGRRGCRLSCFPHSCGLGAAQVLEHLPSCPAGLDLDCNSLVYAFSHGTRGSIFRKGCWNMSSSDWYRHNESHCICLSKTRGACCNRSKTVFIPSRQVWGQEGCRVKRKWSLWGSSWRGCRRREGTRCLWCLWCLFSGRGPDPGARSAQGAGQASHQPASSNQHKVLTRVFLKGHFVKKKNVHSTT